ncbi:DUF3071 domain-containing protein [Corynebacterium tuscaniense]|uniref:DUF3071 domain-containing protein n=1 Tax=Corynebacterium tuscaniense TaxID=302449 RepID=A0A2N6T3E3_9CORY|nr:septation protein SepH [Corynebacterium tuscaniense]PMC63833.1 DUF3071 domain-containing protein [Corynebacterium tuscaniense]
MRELFVVADESTDSLWVLRALDGEKFCISREDLVPPAAPTLTTVEDTSVNSGSGEDDENLEVAEAEPVEEARNEERGGPNLTLCTPEPENPETKSSPVERTPAEPDPLFATPLSLRPKDIQARIRAGASTEELAEEMGVAISRVEPYAHPVLLERAQVAEVAKQSHPVRADGPAPDTLYEVLALSFSSRGHALSEATWDAVRNVGEPWVVRLTWQAGLQEHSAEWSFHRTMGSAPTTEPRDAVAADLIDPSFAQPVRSLSAVAVNYEQDAPAAPAEQGQQMHHAQPDLFAEGDVLHIPEEHVKPKKRRRKAVTPHWEDVLLGVRTNTKRPKK